MKLFFLILGMLGVQGGLLSLHGHMSTLSRKGWTEQRAVRSGALPKLRVVEAGQRALAILLRALVHFYKPA